MNILSVLQHAVVSAFQDKDDQPLYTHYQVKETYGRTLHIVKVTLVRPHLSEDPIVKEARNAFIQHLTGFNRAPARKVDKLNLDFVREKREKIGTPALSQDVLIFFVELTQVEI